MEAVRSRPGKLPPGSQLGETYQIVRLIGEGGMGEVYEARHARLSGRYAVKLIRKEFVALSEMAVKRFKREAEVTSSLQHPNIVQVIDFNMTPDGSPYIVMEFVEGIDLETRMRRRGPMPIVEALPIVEQIASALAAAHGHGVIHRDLKPQNVLLVSLSVSLPGQGAEFVKVVDFGISKATSAETLTGAPIVMGTPHYMAPEQARGMGEEIDGRADQFALGAMTYELLSGRKAFPGETVTAVIYNVVHEPPEPLTALVGPLLDGVLQTALAKERGARFASMTAFVSALRAAATATGSLQRTGTQGGLQQPPILQPDAYSAAAQASVGGARAPASGAPVGLAPATPAPSNRTETTLKTQRRRTWLAAVLALLAIGGGVGAWVVMRSKPGLAVDSPAAATMRAALKEVLAGERSTLATAVQSAARVTELHNAAHSHIDALTFRDLFDTEDWWQPYKGLAVAVFEGERLLASSRVAEATAAGWVLWRRGESVTTEILAADKADGQPAYLAAGVPFGAKRPPAGFGLVLARPLDQAALSGLATRAGAALLAITDGKRVVVSSDPNASAAASVLVGREGQPAIALPDGRTAFPLVVGNGLWLWSVAPRADAR
jgi:serine/threonine protein kinase